MRYMIFALSFLLATTYGNCGLFGQNPSLMVGAVEDPRDAAEITREYYRRYGTWMIPVRAGNRANLAMLATGSNATAIHAPVGESDYPEFPVMRKATSTTALVFTGVPLTFLGGEEKSSLALGMNLSLLRDHLHCPFSALAGLPYFCDKVVRLDPEHGTVSLEEGPTGDERYNAELEILWKKDLPYVACELPILGKYPLVLDTGDSGLISLTRDTVDALERMGKLQRFPDTSTEFMNSLTGNRSKVNKKNAVLEWIEFGG